MHILVIGAAGMLGRKLTQEVARGRTRGVRAADKLTLVDVTRPERPDFSGIVELVAADLAEPGVAGQLVADGPDVIFHLAAIVSGEAEADFEKGYRINLDGTRALFEAIRKQGAERPYCPRVVFTSSIAVFGTPFPDVIGDDHVLSPLTSYGTQKAIGELMLADYSRRGFLDGVGVRLPTIVIRPGKPNKAASSFFSGILREPLAGQEAVLPVADTVRHWFASPRAAVGFLLHAASMDTSTLGVRRSLNMPGVAATVAEEIEALKRAAGDAAAELIRREPDPVIEEIVAGWPRAFDPNRALSLGFSGDASFDAIVDSYIEDELGGLRPA